jgi:hypothetical protein
MPELTMDISIQGKSGSIVLGALPNTAVTILHEAGKVALLAIESQESSATVVFTQEGLRMLIAALEKARDAAE